ncbi:MAG: DUF4340 domain-containing protein [Verrucomicrobiota bacterium]
MKLRNLTLIVALLIAASALVWFLDRPAANPADRDPRVGRSLAGAETLADAARVTITDDGRTVTLARAAGDDAGWIVANYHDLPADFTKLATLTRALLDAKVDRFVTASPAKIERLGFGQTRIEFIDTNGTALWAVDLGKTADSGGRFLRFDGAPAAYLARLNTWIDPVAKNWADSALVALKPADVARVEIGLPDGSTVTATRETVDADFTSPDAAEGETLKTAAVTSLLNTLTGLRFTDTAAPDAEEAVAAREHARTVKLTTFDDQTLTIALGRRPAPPAPEKADDKDADAANETPAPAAGPVFALVSSSETNAAINVLMERRAFQVGEFTFTGLPADRAALFEAP